MFLLAGDLAGTTLVSGTGAVGSGLCVREVSGSPWCCPCCWPLRRSPSRSAYHLPLRDPDGVNVPTYIRLPLILLATFLADVVPRAVAHARGLPEVARLPAHRGP